MLDFEQAITSDNPTLLRSEIIERESKLAHTVVPEDRIQLYDEISKLRSQVNRLLSPIRHSRSYWIAPGQVTVPS